MLFDDRLATVLRSVPRSDTGARTQFRQLIDLLGSGRDQSESETLDEAFQRLGALADEIAPQELSAILRQPGLRLRNPKLALWLAEREPQCAAAAMATARLVEQDWLDLIPRLPITARGFLRHRRDLPNSARELLRRLGVGDLVLPEPSGIGSTAAPVPTDRETPELSDLPQGDEGIGQLVRRIEAFRRMRQEPRDQVPEFDEVRDILAQQQAFDFSTDAEMAIDWADPVLAPLVVGMTLGPVREEAVAAVDARSLATMAQHLPVRDGHVVIDGPPALAGTWRIDASAQFTPASGAFAGFVGRLQRKPEAPELPESRRDSEQDRIRQLLHELRTPVNAIQGFAEIIQQQLFGAAPNEYRALAAGVAVDAARLLAGFDEIDRLARLESGALDLGGGAADFREAVAHILRRLEGALRPRNAAINLECTNPPFLVCLADEEALQLVWRLLATLAGSLSAGERIMLTLDGGDNEVTLEAELPASLYEQEDLFVSAGPPQPRAISAGMFGTGFALRLARAEVQAAGGTLLRASDCVILTLPVTAAADGQAREPADNGEEIVNT